MEYNNFRVSVEELEAAAQAPILQLEAFDSPLVIESMQLLRKGREYFVHVRSNTRNIKKAFRDTKALQSM